MSRKRKSALPTELVEAHIESLTHEGKGVAHVNGKVVFIDGALPGEQVLFRYTLIKKSYDEGETVEVRTPSVDRVAPACRHFSVCGGCSLQHLNPAVQLKTKQSILVENLSRIGKVSAEEILPATTSHPWGYRRRARLGVKYVVKKEKVLVGFREKRSALLADIDNCLVLDSRVGERIEDLRSLLSSLDGFMRIPQIEVAMGDEDVALIFRHLDELTDNDLEKLVAFGKTHRMQIYGQLKGPDSIKRLWAPNDNALSYVLPSSNVTLRFRPSDFTQVNYEINRKLVELALGLLDLNEGEQVLDLFCGLGNFTIPLAKRCAYVVGVEGSQDLVNQGKLNAEINAVSNIEFHAADLTQDHSKLTWAMRSYDKVLIDPPRSGAFEVMGLIASMQPQRIVYVSCNPATLARDAHELVNVYGYKLSKAGVLDMFPHTAHVESIAVFDKQ